MNNEELFILAGAKIEPKEAELERMNEMIPLISNWGYLTRLAVQNGLAPLISKKLTLLSNNNLIPERVKGNLQQAYFKTLSRSIILYDHFHKIVTSFNKENIPVIALKGIYLSAFLYKDIGLRQLSDIDLLVKEQDTVKCLEILQSLGYLPDRPKILKTKYLNQNLNIGYLAPMILNGVPVDIHTEINKKQDSCQINVNNLWISAKNVQINDIPILVMDMTHLLIHLCMHIDKHFSEGKVQFTCYSDITNILDHYHAEINWGKITKLCREYNCTGNFFKHIIISHKYFNAPVPVQIITEYKSACKDYDITRFTRCFRRKNIIPNTAQNIEIMKQFDGPAKKIRYIVHDTFPSRGYMMWRYGIRNRGLVWLYYPYRFCLGVRQVIAWAGKKLSGKS